MLQHWITLSECLQNHEPQPPKIHFHHNYKPKKKQKTKQKKVCGHKSDHLQTLGTTSGALLESLEILLLGGSQHCCQDSVILPLTQTWTRGRERGRQKEVKKSGLTIN